MKTFQQPPIGRRKFLGASTAVVAGTVSLLALGCGDDSPGDGGPSTLIGAGPTPTPSKEQPQQGGVLNVPQPSADLILNNGFPFVSYAQNFYLHAAVMESLVRYNDSLKPELVMADRYDLAPDFSEVTIAIKQGLTFHNGQPVTPEDVFFAIDVIIDPKKFGVTGSFQLVNFAKMIVDRKKLDERTMVFTFDKPRVNITDFWAQLQITHAASYPKLIPGHDIQGTGPFAFKSWTPGRGYRLEANPNYHLRSKYGGPYLEAIAVVQFPDFDAAGIAFEAGDVDLCLGATGSVAKRFRDKRQTRMAPKMGLNYVGCNVTNPLLKDARVRQALFLAIDRQRFQKEIGEGFGSLTVQPWPKTSPAFDPALETAMYDPAKAKDLLKQAGFTQNKPLQLDYGAVSYASEAAVLKENWHAIGVNVDLVPEEANLFIVKFAGRQLTDLWIGGHQFSDMAPLTNFQQTFPYRIPNISYYGEPGSNTGQEYVQMIKDLESLDPLGGPAKAIYKRFNQLFVTEAWLLPLSPLEPIELVGSKLRGMDSNLISGGAPNFALLWKKA